MKIILVFLCLISFNLFATELKVMSFNTMCKLCDFHKDYGPFDERLENIVDTVKRNNPDLIAMQEVQNSRHAKKISEKLNNEYYVLYKKFWLWPGTDSMLLVRKTRFEVLDHDGIWLGPKSPKFNLGWQKRTPRKLEWAHLKDLVSGLEFKFMGIHFDNNSENKQKSAEFVADLISKETLPVILAGDSNLEPEKDGYKILAGVLNDSFLDVTKIEFNMNSPMDVNEGCPSEGTFPECRIDHVFYTQNTPIKTTKWVIDLFKYYQNIWHVSDHRAGMAIFEMN